MAHVLILYPGVVRAESIRLSRAYVSKTGLDIKRAAQREAPKRTGLLARSITARTRTSGWQVISEVGTSVPYARYVHDGTRPHLIRRRTRQALRFASGTGEVFADYARHPGTKAAPFLTGPLQRIGTARDFIVTTT